jgi:tetratricopeptide (TPR) repeat protein
MPARLPLGRRRYTAATASAVLGGLIGFVYADRYAREAGPVGFVVAILAGALLLFVVTIAPKMARDFFRKIFYRIALENSTERVTVLSGAAYRRLTEPDQQEEPEEQRDNDLAVIACLRREYAVAAASLARQQPREASGPEAANLMVALASTQQWDELDQLLAQSEKRNVALPEANLARIAFYAPEGPIWAQLEELAKRQKYQRVWNNLGVRRERAGRAAEAESNFAAALAGHNHYAPAHTNLGALYYERGDLTRALGESATAASSSAGEAVTCSNLGALLCQAGDLRMAARWLRHAQTLDARNAAIEVNLGNAYAIEGKYDEALAAYQKAGRLGATAAAYHNAALASMAEEQFTLALETQTAALELAPEDVDVVLNMGYILWQLGRYPEAEAYFRQAQELRPGGVALSNLVGAALAAGETDVSEMLALARDEHSLAFYRGLSHLLTAMSLNPEVSTTQRKLREYNLLAAGPEFNKVISAGESGVVESYLNLGLASYLNQDFEEAATAFVNASKQLPNNTELVYPIAIAYLMAAMIKQSQHALVGDPLAPQARELLRQARPYLERAMESRSVADSAAYNLGVVYYLLGEYEKAIAILRKSAGPEAPPHVYNALAVAQARRAQILQREIHGASLMSDTRRRQLAGEVSRLLSSAIHYFQQVVHLQPHSPIVHANLGLAFMLRNQPQDVETAVHHWQLMRQTGGAWGLKAFEQFSRAMSSEEARKLNFQDVEVAFQPLPVEDWVVFIPPQLARLKYLIQDLPDLPDWHMEAYHPLVRRALRARARAERLRRALAHLAV